MLSIIVPVYNVEKYLDACVSSIVNQTYKNLEIILVDDGSTDTSGVICDAWAEKDSRIIVYHKANGGLMSAWKYGVRRASGQFVGFVDSDDWIDTNMCEKMLATAETTGVDMVCTAFVCEHADGRHTFKDNYLKPGFYGKNQILNEISPYLLISREYHDRGIYPSRWTKLFKRELLLTVLEDCDERLTIGEDLAVFFSCLQIAHSIFIMEDFWPYHYRIVDTSMIRSFSSVKYEKIDILKQTLLALNEKYGNFDYRTQIYTDYLALYFRTMEIQIMSAKDGNLIKNLRDSFLSERIQEAISVSDASMLSKKHRIYLYLMKLGLTAVIVWVRRVKHAIGH